MTTRDRKGTGTVRLFVGADKQKEMELQLESTSSQTMRGVRLPREAGGGYNPYDAETTPNAQSTGMHRMQDMRKLSEWIRMRLDLSRKDEE